ncbi:unnamed protein product [Cylindrotheca closterium]|uniref:Uncharacterized protein n=1 Tax=Cylindrotheca closterium TaxID=2856 RepID=A0AAD2FMW4_9STRA|nr:unnamed protein product [Cylindrotheca closterium]
MKSFTYDGGMNEATRIPEGTERLVIASSVKVLPMIVCQDCADTLQEIVFPSEGECNLRQIDGFWMAETNDEDDDSDYQHSEDNADWDIAIGRCSALKRLAIPSSVEIIGNHAFFLCTGLVEVNLSEGLKTIGSNAFGICSSLSKIGIPSTVETIGKLAFGDCIKLDEVKFAAENRVKQIEEMVFSGCASLSDINLPQTIEEIGAEAFNDCRSLKSIDLPKQLRIIKQEAFASCTKLEEIQLYDGIKEIEQQAFEGCSALLRIAIPSTVEYLGNCAFFDCFALVEIILKPGRLKCVPQESFALCDSLQSISIPSTIESIQQCAFTNCSLRSMEIHPDSTIEIEEYSLGGNEQLRNLSWEASPNAWISRSALLRDDSDEEDLDDPEFWKSRFSGYLVHNMCYHASTTKILQLSRSVDLCKPSVSANVGSDVRFRNHAVDKYGMTPFHVLLSAAKRRQDLLDVLLDRYPLQLLGWKDRWGKRPLDGLAGNWTSEAREMTKSVVQKWMIDRMATWGLPAWKENISRRLNRLMEPERGHPRLDELCDQFSYFERVEATSLLELWLWKMAIRSTRKEDKRFLLEDRCSSRNWCGASFVIPIVISFLPEVDEIADSVSSERDDDNFNERQDNYSDDSSGDSEEALYSAKYKRLRFFPSSSDTSAAGDDSDSHIIMHIESI